ncbi:sulfotransferase family protein [Bizionia sp. KMM 8389]
MSVQTKLTKLAVIARNPEILLGKKEYLFVVSHMRSRSTVLCHILGNNPEVCGYKELHRSYKNQLSLINMQIELVTDLKCKLTNKYLLDKLLHNTLISDEILAKTQPKILFLLREPEATIKSIINMGAKTGVAWYSDVEKVTAYYCNRLLQMERLADRLGKDYLFVESDDLIEDTETTLQNITDWLGLKTPLKASYNTFKDTGVKGFGDPLENIKSGVLKATRGYDTIEVPKELLAKAKEAYEKCNDSLLHT